MGEPIIKMSWISKLTTGSTVRIRRALGYFLVLSLLISVLAAPIPRGQFGLRPDDYPGHTSYSTLLKFKENVDGFSDEILLGLAQQSFQSMSDIHHNLKGIDDQPPGVMTILATGNEIYLGTSIRGTQNFMLKHKITSGASRVLKECEDRAAKKNKDPNHGKGGNCGELNTIHKYYEKHQMKDLKQISPRARVATWEKAGYKAPCSNQDKVDSAGVVRVAGLKLILKKKAQPFKKAFKIIDISSL